MGKRISKKLMQALVAKTGLKPPTIYAKIQEIAGPDGNSCGTLVYALEYAYLNGLNPKKFADPDTLLEYGNYRRSHPSKPVVITKTIKVPERKVSVVKFAADPDIPEINLPTEKVNEAKRMAGIYPYIYVLENSVREFIRFNLESIYGTNWWNQCSTADAKNKASGRQDKQGKSRYYGTKAPHPIYLVDIDDLRKIIMRNWKDLESKLPKLPNTQAWLINVLQMIEETRNIVDHNNPISKDDEEKLKVHFKDWAKRITKE
jgi:hypothetical protein